MDMIAYALSPFVEIREIRVRATFVVYYRRAVANQKPTLTRILRNLL